MNTQEWDGAFWDGAYRSGPDSQNLAPPWSIGEPQPPIAALIEAGRVRGKVLDVGCGHAETALALAARGHDVVGLDVSPTAIAAATEAAAVRGLSDKAVFEVTDVSTFTGYDGQFDTIIDSALFHCLPIGLRSKYQQSVARAAAPGALYYILTHAPKQFEGLHGHGPTNPPTAAELREVVSQHWVVDDIQSTIAIGKVSGMTSFGGAQLPFEPDEHGNFQLSVWLLSAHKG